MIMGLVQIPTLTASASLNTFRNSIGKVSMSNELRNKTVVAGSTCSTCSSLSRLVGTVSYSEGPGLDSEASYLGVWFCIILQSL
jgi:hypothetical protein